MSKKGKKKIKVNSSILYFIVLLLLWFPAKSVYRTIPNGYEIVRLLRALLGFKYVLFFFRKKEYNSIEIFLFLYLFVNVFSTIVNDMYDIVNILFAIENAFYIIAMFTFFKKINYNKIDDFFFGAKIISITYLLICFVYSVIIDGENYQGVLFFIGGRAESVQAAITLILLSVMNDLNENAVFKINKSTIFLIIIAFLTAINLGSGQGITMLIVGLILFLLYRFFGEKLWRILTPIKLVLIIAFLNYLVLSSRYQKIEFFTNFITNVLGKSITLTGRNIIFENLPDIYMNSPIIGYGYNNTAVIDALSTINTAYVSAHNSVYQILIDNGLLGLIFFTIMTILILYKLKKNLDSIIATPLLIAIIVFFIGGLVGLAVPSIYYWPVVAMAGNINKLNVKETDNDTI